MEPQAHFKPGKLLFQRRPRTIQEGKIMLLAENGHGHGLPRKEVWAVVPSDLNAGEKTVVTIVEWMPVSWDKTQVEVTAFWRPEDKEPITRMCERFEREYFLRQLIIEEYYPSGPYLFEFRKKVRVRDKDVIRKIDEFYRWREDDDKVWCSTTAQANPHIPMVKPRLSLRKRLKLAGRKDG